MNIYLMLSIISLPSTRGGACSIERVSIYFLLSPIERITQKSSVHSQSVIPLKGIQSLLLLVHPSPLP